MFRLDASSVTQTFKPEIRPCSPRSLMAPQTDFAHKMIVGVCIEDAQATELVGIIVAQCPPGAGRAGSRIARKLYGFGAACIPRAGGVGKAGNGFA